MVREDYSQQEKSVSRASSRYTIEDVIEVVSSVLTEEDISAESAMSNIAAWDSLGHMDIILAISKELGVSLSPSDTVRATSVKAIADIIVKKA